MKRINLGMVAELARKYPRACIFGALAMEGIKDFTSNYKLAGINAFDNKDWEWRFFDNYDPDSLEAKLGKADGEAARAIWREINP
jgi:hypothetical protein